jgi:hypothetical protein
VLASTPWLRSFPAYVAGTPIYAAAVLSVLVPLVMLAVRPARLWLGLAVDAAAFAIYTLLVVLQDPYDLSGLVQGLYRGPSQLLTFALPLVSPRSLMVAPVALTWLAGALAGECLARRWYTMLPYAGFLVAFGVAYAGTQRAASSDPGSAQTRETLLATALLVTLLLMRVAQSWNHQDETAETTQPDGVLPLRGLVIGAVSTLVVVLVAALVVQNDAFPKRASTPQRVPSVNDSDPLTPLSFVAGLRPRTDTGAGEPVFSVSIDKPIPGYFAIANVDFYDGSGWSFGRTFRPSGGVLPADTDSQLRTTYVVVQQYRIASGLASAPWMPFLYRAQKVTGAAVNIDPSSGMIVPAASLRVGMSYTVQSEISTRSFDQIKAASARQDTATPPIDSQVPPTMRATLDRLIKAFTTETGTPSTSPVRFLQAMSRDLRSNYALSTAAQGSSTGAHGPSPTPHSSTPGAKTSTTSLNSPAGDLAGGTGFADVLASILGTSRNGTPEQFSTLLALVARELGVPARVVTGFRVRPPNGATSLPAAHYNVTTADAWTWVEIPLIGAGWVVLDASPGRFSVSNQPTETGAPPPSNSAGPTQNGSVTEGPNGHAVAPPGQVSTKSSSSSHQVLIVLLIVLGALLLAMVLMLAVRKPVRAMRRRRASNPRTRLIGAWQESLDLLTEAGLPELATLTNTEIAALTSQHFGAETGAQASTLGAAASAVAFNASTVIAPEQADQAWLQHRKLRTSVRGQLGIRARVAADLRYHRPLKGRPPTSPPSWAAAAAAARKDAGPLALRNYRGRRH